MTTKVLVIKSILNAQADWRLRTSLLYPDDKRNYTAIELLKRMAAEPMAGLPSLEDYSEGEISNATMTTAKMIGFKLHCGSLAVFIQTVIRCMEQTRAEIESVFSGSEGAR